ncbi:MAG: Asp-tRNA(Asn)/Glu-tRNA(Gln) amidotransferase subunit GatB [Planctomycetes bacterium]|nr:Asp-tRNA(Asn)/Glu-tRNA(Gln) amidotransferase subunit GatB [Planctomycetota bacterium]
MEYEPVIGLETHAELLTESKLWCRCSTRFGEPPNTQTCPICLGMPGVLPVLNERAFELALRAALALNCAINRPTFFDRKNYYYPDLPKNYQVSQNYCNLGEDGWIEIPVDAELRRVGIHNVHLEEDAGKNLHAQHGGAHYSLVDLNRAGTPLLEIVTRPEMHSVAEADAFMHTLRRLLLYAGVSDCKMQEGSLRFEASVSMRPAGSDGLGTRVEVKNLNSIKAVRGALEYEIERQTRRLREGRPVEMETRLWDAERGRSAVMRTKEEAQDYRYFPEPDLLPVEISDRELARVRASVPEMPVLRRSRFERDYGLSEYNASVLTDSKQVADYFEACVAAYDSPGSVANWIMNEALALTNRRGIGIAEFEISPERLAGLVRLLNEGRINARVARDIMHKMIDTGKDAPTLVREEGAEQVSDRSALDPVIQQVIEENPQPVQDYLAGSKKAVGALVGQVMRLSRGKADPKLAGQMLRQKLDRMQ